ncbi:MAG: DUF3854 domain-containing protein [Armatimonadetes bacterium]|nr:DUF3854 domain-containing protein [Armatimonadota bacterium]
MDLVERMGEHYPPVYKNGRHHREGKEYYFECSCGSDRLGLNGNPSSSRYGLYSCFACGIVKGHAMYLDPEAQVKLSGRPKPKEDPTDWETATRIYTWIWRNSTLSEDHAKYLKKRGLDPSLIQARTVGPEIREIESRFTRAELTAAGLYREHEKWGFGPRLILSPERLIVPYFSDDCRQVEYLRSYGPNRTDGFRKMIGPQGIPSRRFLYGRWLLPPGTKALLVTEGEFKASGALSHGYACVGLPGVQCSHAAVLAFCRERGIGAVWLCFDSELSPKLRPGRKAPAQAAVDRLVDRFRFERIRLLRVRLPLAPFVRDCEDEAKETKRKMDLDAYLLQYGPGAFEQVLCEAERLL